MRNDRGSAPLEAAVVYPVALLLILLVVNTALYFHARNIALSAAQEGLRVGRAHGSSTGAGQGAAQRVISQVGSSFLLGPSVSVSRTGDTFEVEVRGEAISLVPLLTLKVEQVARAPIEKWTSG
ncbi:TadE/TadG family type IV pilus assembly protein [Nonomuraea sp. NPDC050556]|uniref:TadE/TadG family type IV pilus assembly protein n=1 Tax=Nonomuraea sp. NPDC050556 TaxID=3364369 RepID=UPI0037A61AAC